MNFLACYLWGNAQRICSAPLDRGGLSESALWQGVRHVVRRDHHVRGLPSLGPIWRMKMGVPRNPKDGCLDEEVALEIARPADGLFNVGSANGVPRNRMVSHRFLHFTSLFPFA